MNHRIADDHPYPIYPAFLEFIPSQPPPEGWRAHVAIAGDWVAGTLQRIAKHCKPLIDKLGRLTRNAQQTAGKHMDGIINALAGFSVLAFLPGSLKKYTLDRGVRLSNPAKRRGVACIAAAVVIVGSQFWAASAPMPNVATSMPIVGTTAVVHVATGIGTQRVAHSQPSAAQPSAVVQAASLPSITSGTQASATPTAARNTALTEVSQTLTTPKPVPIAETPQIDPQPQPEPTTPPQETSPGGSTPTAPGSRVELH